MGSMIFGQFLAWSKKKDMTTIGSSNPGATNVKREFGWGWGLFTSLLDATKGLIAVVLSAVIYRYTIYEINSSPNLFCLVYLAGVFAVIGHCFPVQYIFSFLINKANKEKCRKYKGGKGVSTTGGVLFSVSPYLGLIAFLCWLLIVLIWRYVSLGSLFCMTIATIFILIPPVSSFYLFDLSLIFPKGIVDTSISTAYTTNPYLIVGTFFMLLCNDIILTVKHRPNIIKIIEHKESKLF